MINIEPGNIIFLFDQLNNLIVLIENIELHLFSPFVRRIEAI